MRVVHLVPALFGSAGIFGGAERYALELARHMAERVPTRLVTFGESAQETRIGRLDVRVIANAWHVRGQRTNPLSAAILTAILKADVVHCHQRHVLMSSVAAAACRVTGKRVFATELGGGGWDISAYISTDRWFAGHLHISEYSRNVYGHAANPRAHVILGGVDTGRFCPDEATRRGTTPLFVGRVLPHKGIADLIAALPDEMSLDVVGPAPELLSPVFKKGKLAMRAEGSNIRTGARLLLTGAGLSGTERFPLSLNAAGTKWTVGRRVESAPHGLLLSTAILPGATVTAVVENPDGAQSRPTTITS